MPHNLTPFLAASLSAEIEGYSRMVYDAAEVDALHQKILDALVRWRPSVPDPNYERLDKTISGLLRG